MLHLIFITSLGWLKRLLLLFDVTSQHNIKHFQHISYNPVAHIQHGKLSATMNFMRKLHAMRFEVFHNESFLKRLSSNGFVNIFSIKNGLNAENDHILHLAIRKFIAAPCSYRIFCQCSKPNNFGVNAPLFFSFFVSFSLVSSWKSKL